MRFDSSLNYCDGLLNIRHKGDKSIFTHIQNITPIAKAARELRKDPNKGFTKKRTWQRIGLIPINVLNQHPEWIQKPKKMGEYLNSENGSIFRTVDKKV